MKIELNDITVRELVEGYEDDGGVFGYVGKLGRFYVRGDSEYARIVVRHRKGA